MKKLAILAALTVTSLSAYAAVNATVTLNNFDLNAANDGNGHPIFYLKDGTAASMTGNFYVQVLGGASATSLAAVNTAGTQNSIIPINQVDGFFDGGVGVVPGVTAGATATFQVQAWQGAAGAPGTYATATVTGQSQQWTQATGSWDDAAQPPAPATGPTLAMPASFIIGGTPGVPEPSTIALVLLGGAALLIRRRK